jgi:tellurite methyltransferase
MLAPFVAAAVAGGCSSDSEQMSSASKDEIRTHKSGINAYQLITGADVDDERGRWDALFRRREYVYGREPVAFLKENIRMLPLQGGRALAIPMEEGRNAVFLAKNDFKVDGIDYSEVALQKARRLARENGVSINGINADLNFYTIQPDAYDVIIDIELHRDRLIHQIKRGLKRGGIVMIENYTVDQIENAKGKTLKKDYLLERGELKELFKDYQILVYRESNDGKRAVASLIARKP